MPAIPEGYTYKRCDEYSKDEFLGMYKSKDMHRIVEDYVKSHPKDIYNTDDEIAVHQIHNDRSVNSMYDVEHKRTTKRYHYSYNEH